MALFRKSSGASAIALAMGLTACGGGGGGVSSTPFVPRTPTPTPTPTSVSIGPAARATAPNANLFPQATASGPTMQEHATTAFPLLQTVVTTTNELVAGADTPVMNGGATLTFKAPRADNENKINLSVPGLFADMTLVAGGGYYCDTFCGQVGSRNTALGFSGELSWTSYGFWFSGAPQTRSDAAFVTGYATPSAAVPTSGTATYNGSAHAQVFYPNSSKDGINHGYFSGDASLQANFGTRIITGNLTNMTNGSTPWNSVSLLGAISGGNFTGTTAATSAPGTLGSLSGSATGTLAGMFFGPVAQELGAVWTLSDGTSTAIGTIGAKDGP